MPFESDALGCKIAATHGILMICLRNSVNLAVKPMKSSPCLQLPSKFRSSRPFSTKPQGFPKETIVMISAANSLIMISILIGYGNGKMAYANLSHRITDSPAFAFSVITLVNISTSSSSLGSQFFLISPSDHYNSKSVN